ncbi:MAG: DUF368 domain-containing protein [Elusimicrobia bacterium]|nr:DUF368 domain-containing protein [Elusimicrobiota bacterium]
MNYLVLFIKGMAYGAANIVPGISGATIAVIIKVYEQLVGAITINYKKLLANAPFLIPFGVGAVIGLFLFARVFSYLLIEFFVPSQMFFLGLIIGCIPAIYKECIKESKLTKHDILPLVAGIAFMLILFAFAGQEKTGVIDGGITLGAIAGVIVATFVSGFTMIIPGVSGAVMLKTFGYYTIALNAVSEFNIALIALFGFSGLSGLLIGAKLISTLIRTKRKLVYCVILGLIIGSAPSIFPYQDFRLNLEGTIGIFLFVIGAAIPVFLGKRNNN